MAALGLIETRGMVGAIEAADTAAKTADVRLLGFERVGGGLVTLRLSGDIGSVQIAVEAAARAAANIGELLSSHVIARPHADVVGLLDGVPEPAAESAPEPVTDDALEMSEEAWRALPVPRLRQLARRVEGLALRGREISRANKEELIEALRQAQRQTD